MRVFLPATLAAFVAAGATFAAVHAISPAVAQDAPRYQLAQDGQRYDQRSQERAERRQERMQQRFAERMARLKTELKLTAQQEPLFASVEAQMKKAQADRRAAWTTNRDRFRNAELPDRLDLMSERAAANATAMRELSGAVKPLWATLSPEQKEIVRKNMPRRGPFGEGGRGEGRGEGRRG
jgi:hypothetical protein